MKEQILPFSTFKHFQVLGLGLMLAIVIEALTVFCRFGLQLQSTRDSSWIALFTFGYRIHHGYIGVVFLCIAVIFFLERVNIRNWLIILSIGLILSDLAHHFLVLWPIVGTPQFDFVYPDY